MKSPFILLPALLGLALGACRSPAAPSETVEAVPPAQAIVLPYNLNQPDRKWFLPEDLEEISGLGWYKNDQVACVQDEDGIIYLYDLTSERISGRRRFGPGQDYEGVEVVDSTVWAVTSGGDLIRLQPDSAAVETFKTPLKQENNVEGLAYDSRRQRLLLACKDEAHPKESRRGRAVYAFDLQKLTLIPEPVLLVRREDTEAFLEANDQDLEIEDFRPSGIAVEPGTGYYYLIAANGQLLIVLNTKGKVVHIARLPKKVFRQPEGICFSPEGDLLIANEAAGGTPTLLRFKRRGK